MITINEPTATLAAALRESGNFFRADNPHELGAFLRDYVAGNEDGWQSDFAPEVDLTSVDWPVVGWLVSD